MGFGDLLAWSPPTTARHSIVQQLPHRLGGRIREFREAAILIFSPRTGWLAWASRNFAAVILNGRPGWAAGRREALQHAVHNPLRSHLAAIRLSL